MAAASRKAVATYIRLAADACPNSEVAVDQLVPSAVLDGPRLGQPPTTRCRHALLPQMRQR